VKNFSLNCTLISSDITWLLRNVAVFFNVDLQHNDQQVASFLICYKKNNLNRRFIFSEIRLP
jgi:hypothetical protein